MKKRYRYGHSTYFNKIKIISNISFNFNFIYCTQFVSAFRQDICETSTLNNWTENSVPSPSAQPVELTENQSNNQR